MKGRLVKNGDGGHVDHLSAAKAASMKGRPIKSGELDVVTTADGSHNPPR